MMIYKEETFLEDIKIVTLVDSRWIDYLVKQLRGYILTVLYNVLILEQWLCF